MNRIKSLREEHGMKQTDLATILNVRDSAISKYESEKIPLTTDTIIRLARFFKVSTDYLLGLTDSKEKPTHIPNDNTRFQPKRLKKLLDELDDGLEFCSSLAKIQKSYLEMYLQGTLSPPPYEICKIIEVLNTSADYLFGLSDTMHPTNNNVFKTIDDFPRIFSNEAANQSYLNIELSNKLNVSVPQIERLLSGEEAPDSNMLYKLAQIFEKSTDYLLGLSKRSRGPDNNKEYPFKMNKISLERIQTLLESDTETYWCDVLCLTEDELYNFYHYGFIPHIDIIQKLCYITKTSADYILGLSDSKFTIISEKKHDEDALLTSYRKLDENYKKRVDGFIAEQILQQDRDSYMRSSVAADEPLKKTGTTSMAK